MRQDELKKCALCSRGVMHAGCPVFYKVSLQSFGVDLRAVQRRHGLEMMLGSPALAAVMGPNEDIAKPLHDPVNVLVCQDCLTKPGTLAAISEAES